jgi:hypothetical protein
MRNALPAIWLIMFASISNAACKYLEIDLKQADKIIVAMDDSRKNLKALGEASKYSVEKMGVRVAGDNVELSIFSFEALNLLRGLRDKMKVAADRDAIDATAAPILDSAVSYFGSLADYLTIFSSVANTSGVASEASVLRDKARQFVRLLSCD